MENVRKIARSQSVKMTELLRLPSQKEDVAKNMLESKMIGDKEDHNLDSDQPTTLPILRVAGHEGTKQQRREKQRENKDKVNGKLISSWEEVDNCGEQGKSYFVNIFLSKYQYVNILP